MALLREFIAGRVQGTRDPAVREHLVACESCRMQYRDAVQAAADVAGTHRARREQEATRQQRRRRLHKNSAAALAEAQRRSRGFRLRMLLLPAALVLLMTQIGRFGKPVPVQTRPIASSTNGQVYVDGRPFDGDTEAMSLVRGQRCQTGGEGEAHLRTGRVSLTLGPNTTVLVEGEGRFRLERGALTFEGSCELTTGFGVLESEDGAGRVWFVENGMKASVERDTLRWIDPTGARELPVGPERFVALRQTLAGGS